LIYSDDQPVMRTRVSVFCACAAVCAGVLASASASDPPAPPPARRKADRAPTNLEIARQLNEAFVQVVEKVSPSVVVINVVQKATAAGNDDASAQSTPPRRRFFHPFEEQPEEKSLGQGSGIIIREDGFILTNSHVIEDTESIEVRLHDGRIFKAIVRGVDPQSDLAVIKIEARGLPVAALGDSAKTRVGEFAIAIGAPFSLDYSVTFGHVSAKGRSNIILSQEAATMDQDFIQTDANINPGNSGGPLVNIEGEVIGINTLIRGLHTGIGFAIPSSMAREVSEQLIERGKFVRAWLGVYIRSPRENPDFHDPTDDQASAKGVIVDYVFANGPASKGGLKASDVITAVDGHKVETTQQLRSEIRHAKPGAAVNLALVRQGKAMELKITPSEWEPGPELTSASRRRPVPRNSETAFGLTVHPITEDIARRFDATGTNGVIVLAVDDSSVAARKGIQPGDVISSMDHRDIRTIKDFKDAVKKADLKKGILLKLESGVSSRTETLKSP
jgi:serine protease Do